MSAYFRRTQRYNTSPAAQVAQGQKSSSKATTKGNKTWFMAKQQPPVPAVKCKPPAKVVRQKVEKALSTTTRDNKLKPLVHQSLVAKISEPAAFQHTLAYGWKDNARCSSTLKHAELIVHLPSGTRERDVRTERNATTFCAYVKRPDFMKDFQSSCDAFPEIKRRATSCSWTLEAGRRKMKKRRAAFNATLAAEQNPAMESVYRVDIPLSVQGGTVYSCRVMHAKTGASILYVELKAKPKMPQLCEHAVLEDASSCQPLQSLETSSGHSIEKVHQNGAFL